MKGGEEVARGLKVEDIYTLKERDTIYKEF
jgi:hypothetical protein